MDRIFEICSQLKEGETLADVGCDHGYCAKYALDHDLFKKVFISDISSGSLRKAEALLKKEIEEGKCIPVLADGMKGLSERVDTLLIAGLGGEEIVRILKEGYLPKNFLFQPMKNAEKVRAYLKNLGAFIERDYTFFFDGYYYDLMTGQNAGGCDYTEMEIFFGRENLQKRGGDFLRRLQEECGKMERYLHERDLSEESRLKIEKRLSLCRGVFHGTF